MKNFTCVAVHHEGEFLWCVFEYATDQVIHSFHFEEDAKKYILFLEKGGAFDGFTPKFMTLQVKPKGDINETFSGMI